MTAADIDDPSAEYWVCNVGGDIAGFSAIEYSVYDRCELVALFVHPTLIEHGIGRLLLQAAKQRAQQAGARSMLIHSDPHAEPFYLAAGAVNIGTTASGSIPGRQLPTLVMSLV